MTARRSHRPLTLATLVALVLAASVPIGARAQTYDQRVASQNRMGVTLSNFGLTGNNFANRSPSMEFPLGTGYEHLPHAGLWIGAEATDQNGAFVGVTSACLDVSFGTPGSFLTEFTPASSGFVIASRIPTSPFYDPSALSDEDATGRFNDFIVKRAYGNLEDHRPLQIEVRQLSHVWTALDYQDLLVVRYVIRNAGAPLRNVWVGMYTEFASGPKNAYSCWPPSSGCSPYGSWFSKKLLTYDAPLRLLREHRCDALPAPDNCHFAVTPYWAGLKLLTAPDAALGQQVTLDAWSWNPGNPTRDEDVERYALMSAGTIRDLTTDDMMPVTGDPVELLALGPFAEIASGDSIEVDFALVGGAEIADIQRVADAAQALHDNGYDDQVTPTRISLAATRVTRDRVELTWSGSAAVSRAEVYRREEGSAWRSRGSVAVDGARRLTFVDRDVAPGARYGYRLGVREAGADEWFAGETWIDVPRPSLGLAAIRNPASRGSIALRVTLADDAAASLELLDLAGRVRLTRAVGEGAGAHDLELGADALPAGVYFARLRQGASLASARIVVLP